MNTIIKNIKSWLLGLIDHTYILIQLYKGSRRPKYFRLGWGDLEEYRRVLYESMKSFEEADVPLDLHSKLEWETKISQDGVWVTYGEFLSPLSKSLPPESRLCKVCLVSPHDNAVGAQQIAVVMLPATGEQCYTNRFAMAKALALHQGWSSVIICAPFYGLRRPLLQREDFMGTVAEYLLMNISIIQETALIVRYMLATGADGVCITGFSWGGAMAACSSCQAAQWGADYRKIACVPYAGGSNPSGMVDGILECTIEWDALANDCKNLGCGSTYTPMSLVDTKTKLHDVLYSLHLSLLTSRASGPSVSSVHAVSFMHDKFVKPNHSIEFFTELNGICSRPCKVVCKWLPGGHVWAMLTRQKSQYEAIIDAVNALKE